MWLGTVETAWLGKLDVAWLGAADTAGLCSVEGEGFVSPAAVEGCRSLREHLVEWVLLAMRYQRCDPCLNIYLRLLVGPLS